MTVKVTVQRKHEKTFKYFEVNDVSHKINYLLLYSIRTDSKNKCNLLIR